MGLTLLAAIGRTGFTVLLARRVLPVPPRGCMVCPTDEAPPTDWGAALRKAWRRFLRRLPKLVYFTAPIYVLMFLLQRYGFFDLAEQWLAEHMGWLGFLKPQAMGIIVLHLAAELGAALGAAGSVLHAGGLSARDVVLALMVGNILSTPVRAVRHQFPSYAGFFRPALALRLILANQGLRAAQHGPGDRVLLLCRAGVRLCALRTFCSPPNKRLLPEGCVFWLQPAGSANST